MFGKKFCKCCGLKLEAWSPMKEILQAVRKPELEPIEFNDGIYCRGCAKTKRTTLTKDKNNFKPESLF